MEIDLQGIVDIVVNMSKVAIPAGLYFGLGDLIIDTMFGWIFPRRKVR